MITIHVQKLKKDRESGNIKTALAVAAFSIISFFVSFGAVWVAVVGFHNPVKDNAEKQIVKDLAPSDSLRAIENGILQDIEERKQELRQLNLTADSLNQEISARKGMVKKLEQEISRLETQVNGIGDERMKKLASLITGLSENNMKRVIEKMDINLLVSIVLNLTPRKAQTVLNALEPRRALQVAKQMTRIRNAKGEGD